MKPVHAILLYLRDRHAWDDVCDRCGRCCFERTVGADGAVAVNYAAPCEFLDMESHECRVYSQRFDACARCHRLTPFTALFGRHLPPECAYVREFRNEHFEEAPYDE